MPIYSKSTIQDSPLMERKSLDSEPETREAKGVMSFLPEGCIATILSCTSPRDACRLSLVSTIFKSAAQSDSVWERFLPGEYQSIVSSMSSSLCFSSKKELFLSLCDNPVLIDNGRKTISLDKQSGKKCYMISARDLMIVWGDTPSYWRWTSLPEARFPEVAELICVCWLEIRGKINTRILSPGTLYTAYLVFKSTTGSYGFEYKPVEVGFGLVGSESHKGSAYLDAQRGQRMRHHVRSRAGLFNRSRSMGWRASLPRENDGHYPKERADGWLEVELGDFYNAGDEDGELEMSVLEVRAGDWKGGLIVQGIEIRPKQGK